MALSKSYSIGLLAAGMLLIAASCVPLVQALWPRPGTGTEVGVVLPAGGGGARLDVPETLNAVPVLRLETYPAVVEEATASVRYSFSLTGQDGRTVLARHGSKSLNPAPIQSDGDRPPALEIPLQRVALAPGSYTVSFKTGPGGDLIRQAELRLLPASAGLLAPLLTTLMLAILGWLTASLGALQWVRTEAAQSVIPGAAAPGANEERLWTTGCHLSALLGYLLPFGHVIGPLTIWLTKRRRYPAVEQAGRNVLNFQLSITLYILVGMFLSFFLIGILVLFLVVVFHVATVLYASLRAQRGLDIHYPLTINLI